MLARLFHRSAREDNRWEAAAVPGTLSQETQRCLPIISAYWALIIPSIPDLGESENAFLIAVQCMMTLRELTSQQIRQFPLPESAQIGLNV